METHEENTNTEEKETLPNVPSMDPSEEVAEQAMESETELSLEDEAGQVEDQIIEETEPEIEIEGLSQEELDNLWKAKTGLNEETLCGAIETLIFMSDRPIALLKIRKLIDEEMPLRVLHDAIGRLQEEYEQKHHGIRLAEVAQGYQFRTKATFSGYVQDLLKVHSLVLSPTALEVLAIIAYKQPVSKMDVERIRGVDSSHIIRGLIDKRLVRANGRSDEMGRPVLYGTTQEFLEVFNLSDLDQLPSEHELQELSQKNELGKISDIKTLVSDKVMEKFKFDDMSELDQLSQSIKEASSDTSFTKNLRAEEKKKVTTPGEGKTAFELLEEYVVYEQIKMQNQAAGDSNLITTSADPQVVDITTGEMYNTPDFLEDDDEEFSLEENETPIEEEQEAEEELLYEEKPSLEEQKETLSEALDKAFEALTGGGEKLDGEEDLDGIEDTLMEKFESARNEAKELGIDLDFMGNESEKLDPPPFPED